MDFIFCLMLFALSYILVKSLRVVYSWCLRKILYYRYISLATSEQRVVDSSEDVDSLPVDSGVVSRKQRGSFKKFLVMSGKARFGTPKRTEANRMAIRKYLYDICRDHNVLPRHIVDNLDTAVEMVFVATASELTAAAIRHTTRSKDHAKVMRDFIGDSPTVA